MKISKKNLKDISQLIFDGYLFTDVFFANTYITLRTLKTNEVEKIYSKYKYLSKSYNFFIIIDLLSVAIKSIGGIEINDSERIKKQLLSVKSTFIIFLYDKYSKLESNINQLIKIIDYYLESTESKYFWDLFKNSNQIIDFDSVKKINQFQYYWIVQNSMKDIIINDKKEWAKIEYITNSICAFVNPKAYRQLKNKMNSSDSVSEYESKLDFRSRVLDKLEKSKKNEIEIETEVERDFTNQDQYIFNQLKRSEKESKEEYSNRINEMMVEQNKGNIVDEHDRQVKIYELNLLKRLLIEKRIKVEVAREIRNRKKFSEFEDLNKVSEDGIFREEISIIGNDDNLEKIDSQIKLKGFYYEGVSYLEIINEKAFASITIEQKEEAFKMVMEAEIDIEKATQVFLKNLYKNNNKEEEIISNKEKISQEKVDIEKPKKQEKVIINSSGKRVDEEIKVDVGLKDEEDFLEGKIDEEIKNMAAKASNFNINFNSGKDLLKTKNEKVQKFSDVLDKRNSLKKRDDTLDEIFFNDKKIK